MEEVNGLLPVDQRPPEPPDAAAEEFEPCPRMETFDEFYRREYKAIVALAYGLTGNTWSAEELAQEAFAATYQRWEWLRAYDRPGTWARRVVLNRSVSRFRRAGNEARMMMRLRARPSSRPQPGDDDEFWRLVRCLPRRQAQVVALFYAEDMAVEDIAAVLGCAAGTIKAHLHAARASLAARLEEQS